MGGKHYTYEIRFIQMLFFPPWSLYKLATSEKVKQRGKVGIFLLFWGTLQWLLFITSGSNIIMNFIWSNIAICIFFIFNLYVSLDTSKFSDYEKRQLHSMPLKLLVTFTCFFIMYSAFFHSTSRIFYSPLTLNKITWSSLHIIMNLILVFS